MKTHPFNICPTCIHRNTCVLTEQKSQVWSCSEFDEETLSAKEQLPTQQPVQHLERELQLA